MKQKPINQQVVVVVGASSGIGRATALEVAARGATVVVAARNERGLSQVVDEIRRRGGSATAVVADVSSMEQVKNIADVAVAEYGRIDTWVHASAVYVVAPFEKTLPNEMERVVEVNLLGQMYGALAALPHMRNAGRGTLIHVSSVEAKVALPWNGIYAASKHGIAGFLDALRLELGRDRVPIAVVNVMPSTIDTPIFENALTRVGFKPRGTPPVYAPEIVARVIADAAVRPQPEIIVGGGGAMLVALKRFAPRLANEVLRTAIGFEGQLSRVPKSDTAPNNLFSPTPDAHLRVHGYQHAQEIRTSLFTTLQTSTLARVLRMSTTPILRIVARAIEAVWGLRFRGQLELAPGRPTEPAQPEPVAERTGVSATGIPKHVRRAGHAPQASKRVRAKARTAKPSQRARTQGTKR